jgi:hypothetical protein
MTTGRLFPDDDASFDAGAMEKAIALGSSLLRTLRIARLLVENDRLVDLTGLDRFIGLLCAKSLDLPPERGRVLRPHLMALRDEIDTLTTAIHRHNVAG